MPVYKVHKTENYSIISNKFLNNKKLTWKAKGILTYLLSLPVDWKTHINHLATVGVDGYDGTASGFNELIKAGYIKKSKMLNEKKQFIDYIYDIYEDNESVPPGREFPDPEKPAPANPRLLNTNINNNTTVLQRTKDTNIISPLGEVGKLEATRNAIEYLNRKTGKNYRAVPKYIDLVAHRFREGFTAEDFKTVIDNMVSDWGKDEKMSVYLRPETLFGTKFDSYLNRKGKVNIPSSKPYRKEMWEMTEEELIADSLS